MEATSINQEAALEITGKHADMSALDVLHIDDLIYSISQNHTRAQIDAKLLQLGYLGFQLKKEIKYLEDARKSLAEEALTNAPSRLQGRTFAMKRTQEKIDDLIERIQAAHEQILKENE